MMGNKISTYLDYLPAIYHLPDINIEQSPNYFLATFLKIFEKILSGIDDEELQSRKGISELLKDDVIGNIFYPQFAFLFPSSTQFLPPIILPQTAKDPEAVEKLFNTYIGIADPHAEDFQEEFLSWLNEWLDWLSSWVALLPFKEWDVDKKRFVIAKILPLYRMRGSMQGLQALLDLFIDYKFIMKITVADASSTEPVELAEVNKQPTMLQSFQIGNPDTVLSCDYSEQSPILGGARPNYFIVDVYLPSYQHVLQTIDVSGVQQTLAKIKMLCDQEKPTMSQYHLRVFPTMLLGITTDGGAIKTSILGSNTILFDAPFINGWQLGIISTLGDDTWIIN